MSSKNMQKFVKAADHREHYGIRKLTIGAASVLLGTTLWLGKSAAVVHASDGEDSDATPHEAEASGTTAPKITANTKVEVEAPTETSAATKAIENKDDSANAVKTATPTNTQKTADQVQAKQAASEQNVQTTNTLKLNKQEKVNPSANTYKANLSENDGIVPGTDIPWPNKGKNNNLTADQLKAVEKASLAESQQKIDKRKAQMDQAEATLKEKTKVTTDEAAQNNKDVSSWSDLENALSDSTIDQITVSGNLSSSTPLYINGNSATFNSNTTDWNGLAKAEDKATTTITDGHKVTIVGKDDNATISVGKTQKALKLAGSNWNINFKNINFNTANQVGVLDLSQTTGKQTVTFDHVKSTGSALYNGGGDTDVYIKGDTSTDVSTTTHTTGEQQGFGGQYDSKTGTYVYDNTSDAYNTSTCNPIIDSTSRAAANVRAANIVITDGAKLDVTRVVDGDGLVAYDGIILTSSDDQGTKTGRGNIYVGKDSTLNVTLKDGKQSGAALKSSERANIEINNSGIRVNNNGNLVTGENSNINLKVGHGRAISFGAYHFNNDPNSNGNYLNRSYMSTWVNAHPNVGSNVFVGKDSKLNISGRDGIIIGNRGTFISSAGSVTNVYNWGNGNGFDADDYGMLIAGPSSTVNFRSDGKTVGGLGNLAQNNYIGIGEDAKMVVDKDASLSVILVNRGLGLYNDNICLLSEDYHDPLVWVKDGATLDVRSDATSRDSELISVPFGSRGMHRGSRTSYFVMDNAKYINLERDGITTNVTGGGTNRNGDGNLLFMDPTNGDYFSGLKGGVSGFVGQGNYELFKWNNKDLSSRPVQYDSSITPKENNTKFYNAATQVWDRVKGFYQARNGYNTSDMQLITDDNKDITKAAEKGGAAFNNVENGFSLTNSQRLVIMSHNIEPVTPDHPTDYYVKTDVDKHIIREVHYVIDNGKGQADNEMSAISNDQFTEAPKDDQVGQNVAFKGTGYIDITTGKLVQVEMNGDTPVLDKYGHLIAVLDADHKPKQGSIKWTPNGGKFNESALPQLKGDSNYQFERIDVARPTKGLVDNQGKPVYVQRQKYGIDGKPVIKDGKPVYMYKQKRDTQGNLMYDADGNPIYDQTKPIYVQAKDTNGQLKWDKDGNPVYEQAKAMETTQAPDQTKIPGEEVNANTLTPEVYYVVYKAKEPEKQSNASLSFVDDTENGIAIPNVKDQSVSGNKPNGDKPGDAIAFKDGATTVDDIINNGYVFDHVTDTDGKSMTDADGKPISTYTAIKFGNFGEKDKKFTIHFVHGAQLVNPDRPLKTTDPVNKNGITGLTKDELQYQVTETINYVHDNADGSQEDIHPAKIQHVTFAGHTYIDKVTGNLIDQANVANAAGEQITDSDRTDAAKVYGKLTSDAEKGKVTWEATGKNGKILPAVPTVTVAGYTYDHATPTNDKTPATYADFVKKDGKGGKVDKIKPIDDLQTINNKNKPISAIGLTLHYIKDKVPTPTKQGTVNVIFHDTTDNTDIKGYGPKTPLTGKAGDPVTGYTTAPAITTLEGLGYVRDTDAPVPTGDLTEMPKTYPDGSQTVYINMKHDTIPVTPDKPDRGIKASDLNVDVTRTINYQNTDKQPVNGSPDSTSTYKQTAHFVRTAIVDKVNNKLLGYDINGDGKVDVNVDAGKYAWQPAVMGKDGKYTVDPTANTLKAVSSKKPSEVGYNSVDIPEVQSTTVAYNTTPITVTVTYSKTADQGAFQVHFIDEDDNNAVLHSDPLSGTYGDKVNYSPDDQIKALEGKGYVRNTKDDTYVPQTDFNKDNNGKTYIIAFKHGIKDGKTETIKPTETIHFRYEDGSEAKPDVKGNAGDFAFTRTPKIDAVNGHIVDPGTWSAKDYTFKDGQNNVGVITGFVADKATAGNKTATPTDANVEDTVIYRKISQIIPVDESGNKIPGTTPVDYTNDPKDPTKVTPNEQSPEVPNGWTIKPDQPKGVTPDPKTNTAKVTPVDPTKPTNVIYTKNPEAKKGSVVVTFHDDTTNSTISGVGYNSGEKPEGTAFTYNPADQQKALENEGYVYVKTDGTLPKDGKIPADNVSVTIHMKHGVQPVTPDTPGKDIPKGTPKEAQPDQLTKTVDLTVTYKNNDGSEFTGKIPANAQQKIKFTGTAYVDKITGKIVNAKQEDGKWVIDDSNTAAPEVHWTPETGNFDAVTSPDEDGYKVISVSDYASDNGKDVKAIKGITRDNGNIKVVVTYALRGDETSIPSTQTVKFVDDKGNELHTSNTQSFTFTKDAGNDNWNQKDHTFDNVNAPVINGYVAEQAVFNGLTSTPDNPNVNGKIVYYKIANIIPVGPDGKTPIAPEIPYKNDPNDPTKVVPNEPTPEIPGYKRVPDDKQPDPSVIKKGKVTPKDPTKDTPVVYNNVEQATVHYLDQDENNKDIIDPVELNGASGAVINGKDGKPYSTANTIKSLQDKGYELVSDGFPANAHFDYDMDTPQVFNVILKHGHQPVDPKNPGKPGDPINPSDPKGPKYPQGSDKVTADVTRTIEYKGLPADQTPKNVEQPAHFTAEGVLDKVTGDWITPLKWSEDQTIKNVVSPKVKGYHVDKVSADSTDGTNVDAKTLTHTDKSYTVTVTYVKDTTPTPDTETVTVKYYDDNQTDPQDLSSYNKEISGKAGSDLNYTTQPSITDLENKGFKLVSDSFTAAKLNGKMPAKGGNYEVHFIHATVPATPDKPGKPGDPINPKDPNGPKWPEGTAKNDLTKDSTQTITYHYSDGKKPDTTKTETNKETFTKTVVVDKVTGKIISDTPWTGSHTFDTVNTPVVDGYHADKRVAGGKTATVDNPNVTDEVTYMPNGHIIPVDPNHNPIPNVDHPTYPTDPDDPTKVVPDEPVPTVPGRTPETSTVTPKDPGKDTPVIYNVPTTDKGTVNVYVHDNTIGKNLDQYGWSTGNKPVDVGTKVTFDKPGTITELTNKGYKVINPNVEIPAEVSKGTTNVTIYVEHTTTTVTPDKPGKPGDPIDPKNPDGPKYPTGTDLKNLEKKGTQTIHYVGAGDKTPKDNVKDFTFTRDITFDNVTGKIIDNGKWNVDSHKFDVYGTPVIDGYHADKREAGGMTITPDDLTKEVTVTYTPNGKIIPVDPNTKKPIPNVDHPTYPTDPDDPTKVVPDEPVPNVPGKTPETPTVTPKDPSKDTEVPYHTSSEVKTSQTVNFVDDKGNVLKPANVQNGFVFHTKDGVADPDSHTYNNVNVPVIDGYVADKKNVTVDKNGAYVKGQTVTVKDPDVTINVVYHKVGKIVPVDPDGKDIPSAPTPEYKNDPNDPTKVVPDEPVPTIDGFTPSTPKVTPKDPTKDTPVPYTQNKGEGRIVINYVDQDNNNSVLHSDDPEGKFGDKITYTTADEIKKLTDQGYELVKDGFTDAKDHSDFTKENNGNVYEVVMKHGLQPVGPTDPKNPDQKPGKPGEPINPNDPDGPKYPAGSDQVTKTVTRTIHYVDGNGKVVSAPVTETAHFTGTGVLDKVTGEWKTPITWTGDGDLKGAKSPVIDGYHVTKVSQDSKDNVNVDPTTVNEKTKDYDVTVTYAENGHVIPVDPDGNPILGADHPQFPTDPKDPGKVDDGKVPSVPGYKPEKGNPGDPVNPGKNPSDDVKVPYVKNPEAVPATGTVTYVDKTTGKDLKVDPLKGNVGDKITYTTQPTIDDYLNKGYKLVSNTFKDGDETFAKDGNKFTVTLEHDTIDVTPDKPGKPGEPINPNDPDGPKFPDNTGKNDLEVTGHQTIHYTGAGDNTPKDITEDTTFTRHFVIDKVTGEIVNKDTSWTPGSHTFDTHKTPVVDGYVADVKEAGGFKSTPSDPDKTYTVTYKKIGKIVPVDPDGNKIPNAPTPEYKNDPDDPTKVVPDEPVPGIDGYTPSVNKVTPADPTKDTPVVYTKNTPVTPGNPTPTPQPSKPETPKKPAEPAKPDKPATPNNPEPDEPEPDEPEPNVPTPKKRHNKKHNNTPKPTSHKPANWSNNNAPHGEYGNWGNVAPHGQGNGWNNNTRPMGQTLPNGEHIDANGNIVNAKGQVIGYIDKNGKAHYTLPQTGDNQKADEAAYILGGAVVAIGMIGLAGVKKRKKN